MTDALVIGGGPAGAIAGLVLARAGWNVTIVEQHRFPRDKVCGECVSDLGIDILTELGLLPRLLSCSPAILKRAEFHEPGGEIFSIGLTRPMWGLSRSVMDTEILAAAGAAGAKLIQPGRCEQVEPGSRPTVRIRRLADNEMISLSADVVIVADGKPPASLRMNGAAPARLGIKTHIEWDGDARDRAMLFGVRGNYGGIAAVDRGRWVVSFTIRSALARECRGDLNAVMGLLAAQNAGLARRWSPRRQVSAWMASPLSVYAMNEPWPAGVISVGNAASSIEPVGGEGMGLAMATAELAARTLVKCGPTLDEPLTRRLRQSMLNLTAWRGLMSRGIAMLLSRPAVAEMAVAAVAANPMLADLAMRLVKGRSRADII